VQVYLFAREWMFLHLMEAVETYLMETMRPEDALKILAHFVDEENCISLFCVEVSCSLKLDAPDYANIIRFNYNCLISHGELMILHVIHEIETIKI
jgi:hypothetical protein